MRSHPMLRVLLVVLFGCVTSFATATPIATPIHETVVALPTALREVAGGGQPSPVTHAVVAIALPSGFDPAGAWPVLVVSATSDPGFNSSRALMREYADTATGAG